MTDKHTSGPWALQDLDLRGGKYWCVRAPGLEESLAEVHEDDNGKANARLIAAAPDLVAPYRNADDKDWDHLFRMLPDSGHGQFWKAVFTEVRAALSKAKGETT